MNGCRKKLMHLMGVGWLLLVGLVFGQEGPEASTNGGTTLQVSRLETLLSLSQAIDETEAALKAQREKLANAESEDVRKGIEKEIANLGSALEALQGDFGKTAAGVRKAEFDAVEQPAFDLQGEIEEVLRPIFRDLSEATTGLRELDELRTRREMVHKRELLAASAVARLQSLYEETRDEKLKARLGEMLQSWQGRALQEETQGEALQLQIEERDRKEVSVFRRVSQTVSLFCKTRGKNLLLSLLVLLAVHFFLRWAYRYVKKLSPLHRRKRSFLARLMDVGYSLFSVVAGVIAAFVVLYSAGDWVLLVLGVLFVVGILWASKNTLPHVYEQTKLLLNLGPVREGERILYGGLPWRVDSLGLYCSFSNPELTGGELRLPIRALVDLHSRPFQDREPWFPTSLHDWVKTTGGVLGRVVVQTPEQVELVLLGGSRIFYRAPSFLELAPENLSKNFRIGVVFGIDYSHQERSTEEVPALFQERLHKELLAEVGAEGLINLRVEFRQAAASSLDYKINADFAGELASRYNVLERMISRVCVDVCNEHGFVIPFTQVTVHQA